MAPRMSNGTFAVAKTSGEDPNLFPILLGPAPSLMREDGCAMAHRALGESSSIKDSPGEASAPSLTSPPSTRAPLACQRSQLQGTQAPGRYPGSDRAAPGP